MRAFFLHTSSESNADEWHDDPDPLGWLQAFVYDYIRERHGTCGIERREDGDDRD